MKKKEKMEDPKYYCLRRVLDLAYERASEGKGKERHAEDKPFERQDIVREQVEIGTQIGIGQIRKKAKESLRLPPAEAQLELLDIIVYASGTYLAIETLESEYEV
jgi:hypothetical protein